MALSLTHKARRYRTFVRFAQLCYAALQRSAWHTMPCPDAVRPQWCGATATLRRAELRLDCARKSDTGTEHGRKMHYIRYKCAAALLIPRAVTPLEAMLLLHCLACQAFHLRNGHDQRDHL